MCIRDRPTLSSLSALPQSYRYICNSCILVSSTLLVEPKRQKAFQSRNLGYISSSSWFNPQLRYQAMVADLLNLTVYTVNDSFSTVLLPLIIPTSATLVRTKPQHNANSNGLEPCSTAFLPISTLLSNPSSSEASPSIPSVNTGSVPDHNDTLTEN